MYVYNIPGIVSKKPSMVVFEVCTRYQVPDWNQVSGRRKHVSARTRNFIFKIQVHVLFGTRYQAPVVRYQLPGTQSAYINNYHPKLYPEAYMCALAQPIPCLFCSTPWYCIVLSWICTYHNVICSHLVWWCYAVHRQSCQ
jgi:hypothetical protein